MESENLTHIVVTDIKMPFWSMVILMIKWAIAAIPAFIILAVLGGISATIFGSLGMMMGMGR